MKVSSSENSQNFATLELEKLSGRTDRHERQKEGKKMEESAPTE